MMRLGQEYRSDDDRHAGHDNAGDELRGHPEGGGVDDEADDEAHALELGTPAHWP